MGGFAGMIGRCDETVVARMLDKMRHRGPDDRGLWIDDRACLGHHQLATVDVSQGRRPLSGKDGRFRIVYDGTLYNVRDLQRRLNTRNGDMLSDAIWSDAEVILRLYEEEGLDFVRHLDGMYAFVIYDRQTGAVAIARDPLGIKPLYYGYGPDGTLYFASEIKGLLQGTSDVREFPNGHVFRSDVGFRPYDDVRPPASRVGEPAEAVQRVQAALESAVRKALVADVPVGAFLSGGLDSSLVTAIARRYKASLPTFAVGVDGCADLQATEEVAEYVGTHHYTYVMTPADVRNILPEVIYTMESFDPALVRSAVATYFVARLAGEHVKVVLSGEGADELFGGYDYLKDLGGYGELDRELLLITRAMHNTNLQRVDRLTMRHSVEGRMPFLDRSVVHTALAVSPALKIYGKAKTEKWVLRKAAEAYLPHTIIWRGKEKFAIGTGTADVLREWAASQVSDSDYARHRRLPGGFEIKSKEEMYYYRIFREFFPVEAVLPTMGRSRSLDPKQRYA